MPESAFLEKVISFAKGLMPAAIVLVVGLVVVRVALRLVDRSLEKSHMERAAISLVRSLLRVVMYAVLAMVVAGQAGIEITSVVAVDRSLEKSHMERAAISLVRSLLRVVMYAVLAMVVAGQAGIEITSVVALASVASLAISLSFQNALTNVIGGFTLLSTHPFKSGDYVEIAGQGGTVQSAGQGGTVQSIDITYTRLSTADNKIISIPNSAVVSSQIVNYSSSGTRRIDITVGASYDAPIPVVKDALLRAANIPATLFTPAPFVGVKNYGDNAIDYVLQVWTASEDYWTAFYTINENISREFETDHIEFTYPHVNVHMCK